MARNQKDWARKVLCGDGQYRKLFAPKTVEELKDTLLMRSRLEDRGYTTLCRIWVGCKDSCGYGVQRFKGKNRKTQRLAWLVETGSFPVGKEVCHHCDQPSCINKKHLFAGTHFENMTDAKRKDRMASKVFGIGHYCASFTDKEVRDLRKRFASGIKITARLAESYGVSPAALRKIKKGLSWKHIK